MQDKTQILEFTTNKSPMDAVNIIASTIADGYFINEAGRYNGGQYCQVFNDIRMNSEVVPFKYALGGTITVKAAVHSKTLPLLKNLHRHGIAFKQPGNLINNGKIS